MSSTVLDTSMSLDGFIAGPNESVDNGLGGVLDESPDRVRDPGCVG